MIKKQKKKKNFPNVSPKKCQNFPGKDFLTTTKYQKMKEIKNKNFSNCPIDRNAP